MKSRISTEQLSIVVMALALVASAAVLPSMLGPAETPTNATEPKEGTVSTPSEYTETQGGDRDDIDRLRALPEAHTETATDVDPPSQVSASAGSQTMDVRTTRVDGEPALVLEDDRVHDGRWVSVPATWFETNVGGVPTSAYIKHSSGETYSTPTRERGGDVAFYVEEFSTNTVSFSGEVTLSGSSAADGTQYSYDINDLDSTSNFTVDVTGSTATEWDNESGTPSSSGSMGISPAGNLDPIGPGATGSPTLSITSGGGEVHHGGAETGGSDPAADLGDGKPMVEIPIQNPPDKISAVTVDIDYLSSNVGDMGIRIADGAPDKSQTGTLISSKTYSSTGTKTESANYDASGQSEIHIELTNEGGYDQNNIYNIRGTSGTSDYVYQKDGGSWFTNDATLDVSVKSSPATNLDATTASGSSVTFGDFSKGETKTKEIDISSTDSSVDLSGSGVISGAELKMQERSETVDPTIEVNGQTTSYSGTLSDGSTTSLSTDTTWLQSGTNRVNVSVGDGTLSADAPTPEVGLDYSHDATDKVATSYEKTTWLEKYNVSKTYASDRSAATLTIPHQSEVLSIQRVEMRTNGGSWSSVSSSDYSLSKTELTVQLGSVAAGDEVEVRTTGALPDVNNGAITVKSPTTPGEKLDSRIAIDTWNSDSYIAVPQTGDWNRVHVTKNATWDTEEDVRVQGNGEQRLRLPLAGSADETNITTVPLEASPTNGDVTISVESTDPTKPEWTVGPGQSSGDDVEYTFINASDGESYVLYSETNQIGVDSGTASSPLTLTDDDDSETLTFLIDDSASSSSSGGGAVAGVLETRTPTDGNIFPLIGIALAIGALLVVSRSDEQVTQAGEGAASSVESTAEAIPVLGPALGGLVGGLVRAGAQLFRAVLGNQTVAVAVSLAIAIAGVQAGVVTLPAGSLVIAAVAAVAGLSFIGLREFGEFTTQRWVIIVVSTTVVALQVLSEQSLLTAIVESQAWPILAAGGLYLAYQFVQGIRAPDTEQTIVIDGSSDD